MKDIKRGEYDDRQDHIRSLQTPAIEVFSNIYEDRDYNIELEIFEFTAVCPRTGLPDFGTISISYIPDSYCLELKSLKEYFLFFRNLGIFHENVVNRVRDDLVKACSPRYMKVKAVYNLRGGIGTTVNCEYRKT